MPQDNPTKYMSIPEAAKMCGVGRTTMWKWVKSGELKAMVTPGGHHRILKSDIEHFIHAHELPPPRRRGCHT